MCVYTHSVCRTVVIWAKGRVDTEVTLEIHLSFRQVLGAVRAGNHKVARTDASKPVLHKKVDMIYHLQWVTHTQRVIP